MANKYVGPSVELNSFSCPYCGALAHQDWYNLYENGVKNSGVPFIPDEESFESIRNNQSINYEDKNKILKACERIMSGDHFFEGRFTHEQVDYLHNVWLSKCYSCKGLAIWIHDKIIFPKIRHGEEPNADLPEEVRADYEEARTVLDLSPRAAAALLRLCIEKLCQAVGDPKIRYRS